MLVNSQYWCAVKGGIAIALLFLKSKILQKVALVFNHCNIQLWCNLSCDITMEKSESLCYLEIGHPESPNLQKNYMYVVTAASQQVSYCLKYPICICTDCAGLSLVLESLWIHTKYVILEMLFPANLLASTDETEPNTKQEMNKTYIK